MILAVQLPAAIAGVVRIIRMTWDILTGWLAQPVADATIPKGLKEPTEKPNKPELPKDKLPVREFPSPTLPPQPIAIYTNPLPSPT